MTDFHALGVSRRPATILLAHGVSDSDELVALTERELMGLPGFGPGCLADVNRALEEAGLTLAHDEFAPYVCARDGRPGWDVNLADLFLCDECAGRWQEEAFDSTKPSYTGSKVAGFCVSCNRETSLRLRQWLLCGNCERVARSIGKGVAAERFLLAQWHELVAPHAGHLELRQTDEPVLRGRREGGPSKVAAIDFAACHVDSGDDLFGFEQKTGKKYISGNGRPGGKMPEFQLDTTDCDDMRTVMGERGFPVYLIHVQVIDRVEPPTARYIPLGAWWTDPFSMGSEAGFKRIQQRSRETRDAAYFNTSIFRDFSTFADHLTSGEYEALVERLRDEGIPPLYHP